MRGLIAGLITLACAGHLAAVDINVEDFLLPVAVAADQKAALRQVKEPAAIRRGTEDGLGTVEAPTAQDAINTVVDERVPGCQLVKFGAGFGYVAVGQGAYAELANPTATRIAKRNAYLAAYLQARAELTKTLTGLSTSGRERIRNELATFTDATADAVNLTEKSEENLTQAARMLLRGFVVYEVEDDVANRRVLVSIVTTPKTRRQVSRPTASFMEAGRLETALAAVTHELVTGIAPPVGLRICHVPGTGSVAFVGYGSAVIRYSEQPGVQAKLRIAAETAATARAQQSLCAAVTGEDTSWRTQLDETTLTQLQEFDAGSVDDPAGAKRIADARQRFLNVFRQQEEFKSFSAGTLPAGVRTRSWVADDGGTAFAMAVFLPGVIAVPDRTPPSAPPPVAPPPATPPGQGPTGTVTDPGVLAPAAAPAWTREVERQAGWLYGLGQAAGEQAALRSLQAAQLQIAQQLVVSVAGSTVSTEDVTTVSDETRDRIRIRENLFTTIRTESAAQGLVGVQILRQEVVDGTSWTLVGLDTMIFATASLARIVEIDARLQPLVAEPDPLTVDYLKRVTLALPLVSEREGLGLMLLGLGREVPASPLTPGLLHGRIGRLADGTSCRLEGHAEAKIVQDAVLDCLDGLGLTVRQDPTARFELRLREKRLVRVIDGVDKVWHKVKLTGAITAVDNRTQEVIGSLEASTEEASTIGEADAVDRCRGSLMPRLKDEIEAKLLLQLMGK